jgi:uncharacterized protein
MDRNVAVSALRLRTGSCLRVVRTFLDMRIRMLLAGAILASRVWSQPAPLSGFPDEGAFFLYWNEERVATVNFRWMADGTFQSRRVLSVARQSVQSTAALTPDAEGRWTSAVFEDDLCKRVFQRAGSNLTFTFPHETGNGAMPKDMLTFDRDSPALISQALRRYDAAKGGRQTFPLLVLSAGNGEPLTVERQDMVERTAGGRRLRLVRWTYAPSGCEIHVLAGQDGRVYMASGLPWFNGWGVSSQHSVYVRQGYEELLKQLAEDFPVSKPAYEVKLEAGVKAPMRDGVRLSTDLYLPVGPSKMPVGLIRTPYAKEMEEIRARFYARRGYAAAVQDVRGRFASEGKWEPVVNESKDGYDAIEWLARQPWSNGKVGMVGASYLGWVQWLAASLHPPHLTTIIPNCSPTDPFHNIPYDHGVPALQLWTEFIALTESNATAELSGATIASILAKDIGEWLKPLPVIELDKAVLGKESPAWRSWMAHTTPDGYWAGAMFLDKLKDVDIPIFHQSGWFDGDAIGAKLNYLKMDSYGHANQKLTIGPWGHGDIATRFHEGRDFGQAADIDLQRDYLRWFDYWLKGTDNGILKEPLVSMFVMGSNRWLYGPKYPLPETRFEKLYLASGGHANTSKGDGRLGFTPPEGQQAEDRYVYDPGDPTPVLGCLGEPDDREQITAAHKDMLVYTAAPFEKPYTIAGPISAVLYASSSARDTDWFVRLMEVDRDGKCLTWGDGVGQVRARYRNSMKRPEMLQPEKIYRYDIDLWHTGITIAPGHRLRVEVASAAFPLFSRNLNTGGNNETETRFVSANQAIYHDARHASYILLPMIPEP